MEQLNYSGNPRVFAAAWAKDILVAQMRVYDDGEQDDWLDEPMKDYYNDWADHIYDWVMQDQFKPMSDAQLIKIETLLRLVKPDPERLKHIEAHLFKLNIKEASELIEELLKMKPSESGANRMVDRYSETAESIASDVRKAVERDGN